MAAKSRNNSSFARGLAVRRAVMGRVHVDRNLAAADDFTRAIQELTTGFAWGEVWTRPGLTRKTRSLINVALLCALNRPHEFKGHVKGALNNGVSIDEIKETLIHVAVYAGFPASLDGYRLAREARVEAGALGAAPARKAGNRKSARRRRTKGKQSP